MVSSLQPPMTDAEHQAALYRRRQALAQIDNAKFSLYHVRAIIVAGVGFFTDAYDIFAVNFANLMIGWAYSPTGALASTSDTALKISTSAGTVCGQVGFGFLADHLGRKRMYGIELILMIVATLGLSLSNGGPAVNFIAVMIFWRVLLGMGVGGDYPLSSIITSEFATVKWRGAMMAAVFANQGFGQFTAALVSFLCTVGFRSAIQSGGNVCDAECSVALDKSWRIIYGFGAVPACFALYFRLTIPETIRYTLDVSKDDKQAGADAIHYVTGRRGNATADDIEKVIETSANPNEGVSETRRIFVPPKASFRDFRHHFGQWKNGKVLLGTAGSWFFLDIAFYGLGLNTSIILPAIGYGATGTVYQQLYNNGVGNLILSCAGLIPGYWFAVATIDTVGRKPLQFGGFAILTVLFCIFGFGFHVIPTGGLFALYCLCNFFQVRNTSVILSSMLSCL